MYDKLVGKSNDRTKAPLAQNEFFNPKLVKKTQQEIMRRYHPDKHASQCNNEGFMNDINEICRVTNKIFEAISDHRK
jgi:hypothetical protein